MPAQKVPVEFGEWRPDVALLDTKFASEVENVFAGVNSYLPFPSLTGFSASLSSGNDSYTKVLLPFSGADAATVITDINDGGSAHVWTANGNAQLDTAEFKFGTSSLLCDGTGDYVTTPDHADFTLGNGDFTIDCWFNCTKATGIAMWMAGQCSTAVGAGATISFAIARGTNNHVGAYVFEGIIQHVVESTTQFTDTLNTGWHHLAFVRWDNIIKLFIDGMLEDQNSFAGTVNNSANALSVGRLGEVASPTWQGWIDEFRISVGVARWRETFTPPGTAYGVGGIPCGLYSARTKTGEWKIYGGTRTKLVGWSQSGWTDLSRTVGGAYHVQEGDLWMFEQSGSHLIAVNANDAPQVIDIDTGTSFADLPGSPPKATNVKQMGDFLVLSGLADGTTTGAPPTAVNNRCIVWSGINDIESWTPGTDLCDMQEFPDGGPVQGIAGGEIGYVLQERAIRTMQFLPGDTTFIFNFSRVLDDRGCVSKYGFDTIGNNLYFVSEDGFYSMTGQQVSPIGADKVNDWFLANSDVNRRNVIHCIVGVNKPRVVWVYHTNSASPMYDKQIIFDWSNARWAKSSVSAFVWSLLGTPFLDLDTEGTETGDYYLDSTAAALDSFGYVGGRPLIGAINPDGFLSTLQGPNLPATMETAEVHLLPGMRSFISDAYPLDDARDDATGTVAAGTRERLQDGYVWGQPVTIEITGSAALYSSARLMRFRRFIPAATTWTHAQGVVIEAQQDGTVA
jgi:hypothetical protein